MPRENNLRDQVRDLISRDLRGFVTNHEDKFTLGIPDTSFAVSHHLHTIPGHWFGDRVTGWIEHKNHHSWPKLWNTELRLGLRPEQRVWIKARWRVVHDTFILIRISDEIFMFTGEQVDKLFYPISREEFDKLWVGKWNVKINAKEFLEIVCETR